jgi:biopolymer transport protein ExbD
MIDTMFFLLVFFMMATLSMTLQRGMPVNLPDAGSVSGKINEKVTLTITEDGILYFNKEKMTVHGLQSRLRLLQKTVPNSTILINADKKVTHGLVIEVLDSIRLNGITKIAIAIKPKQQINTNTPFNQIPKAQ